MTGTRTVLHVLPHPGGGGETYVDSLARMDGYRSEKTFVAPGPTPTPTALAGAVRAQLSARRCDLLHVHGEVAAALCLPRLALSPSVVTIHGLHLVRRLNGWQRALAESNLRLVVRAASRAICVGEAELADVESVVGRTEKLVLVHNGVELPSPPTPEERAAARADLDLPDTETVGVYIGALDRHKEPIVVARAALDAARRGVPLVLLFAGEGPLRGDLEELAGGGGTVRLAGFRSDVRRLLAAADFFVLPSRREGLSFALLEAMSIGLPPVVSDVPANTEVVGDAGLVVPAGGIDGFGQAFERLAADAALRASLGERARSRVEDRFSVEQMLEGTRRVYDGAISDRGATGSRNRR